MNRLKCFYWLIFCFALTSQLVYAGNNMKAKKILVIGLPDNVKSNYYYDKMIAEETGMEADNIDTEYNRAIMQTMVDASLKNGCEFIPVENEELYGELIKKISVKGEEEHCTADLSGIAEDELQMTLYDANADYLLVLNQHYLKYQDQPMQTVFHFVCYSLFDREKNEIMSDNYYFTCINPEQPEKIKKISRKSTSKMTTSLLKALDRDPSLSYK